MYLDFPCGIKWWESKKVTSGGVCFLDRLTSPTQDLLMYVKGRSRPLGVTAPLVFWGSNRKIMVEFFMTEKLMETQTNQRNSGKLLFFKKKYEASHSSFENCDVLPPAQLLSIWDTLYLYPSKICFIEWLEPKKNDSSKKFLPSAWIWYQNLKSEILCFTTMRCPFKNSWSS